jgi:hypothetical protein
MRKVDGFPSTTGRTVERGYAAFNVGKSPASCAALRDEGARQCPIAGREATMKQDGRIRNLRGAEE